MPRGLPKLRNAPHEKIVEPDENHSVGLTAFFQSVSLKGAGNGRRFFENCLKTQPRKGDESSFRGKAPSRKTAKNYRSLTCHRQDRGFLGEKHWEEHRSALFVANSKWAASFSRSMAALSCITVLFGFQKLQNFCAENFVVGFLHHHCVRRSVNNFYS